MYHIGALEMGVERPLGRLKCREFGYNAKAGIVMGDSEIGSAVAEKLIRQATREEKRLLAREAQAETRLERALARLSKAEAQLSDAQARVERRTPAVVEARAELRACQEARAKGPVSVSDKADPDAAAESETELNQATTPAPAQRQAKGGD